MKKAAALVLVLALIGAAAFLYLSRPRPLEASLLPQHAGDVENGKLLFTAGGCLSCHKPASADVDAALPSGGLALKTPVGTFYPPNLTPDAVTGIGNWSKADFANAMTRGVSPEGTHYLPAFPYTSYAKMRMTDVLDIFAYLRSLPATASRVPPPDIPLLPLVRRGTGLWKALAFAGEPYRPDPEQSDLWNRGAYLVQGPGHCSECHTPRNVLMIPDTDRYLAGGPHPEGGKDKVPSLRGLLERRKYKDVKDLVSAFQWGEAFGYENLSSGGMGAVQTNLSKLPETELTAIATYLTSLK